MKALITGVSGFIGPYVVRVCLSRGWQVVGAGTGRSQDFDSPSFSFLKKKIQELVLEDLKGIDYVFHLAFKSSIPDTIARPVETTSENIGMTARLLDLSDRTGVKKFIFASTASIYGNNPVPWSEDMPPDPLEPYSWQKLSCEFACRMWTKRYGLPTVNLRLFQVFGEDQREDTVIALFSKAKQSGRPLTLTNVGTEISPKSCSRDFVYAGEVASAFVSAALSNKTGVGEVINIGSGHATKIEDIAKLFSSDIVWIPKREYEVEKQQADTNRARNLLGLSPRVDVIEWLKNTDSDLI